MAPFVVLLCICLVSCSALLCRFWPSFCLHVTLCSPSLPPSLTLLFCMVLGHHISPEKVIILDLFLSYYILSCFSCFLVCSYISGCHVIKAAICFVISLLFWKTEWHTHTCTYAHAHTLKITTDKRTPSNPKLYVIKHTFVFLTVPSFYLILSIFFHSLRHFYQYVIIHLFGVCEVIIRSVYVVSINTSLDLTLHSAVPVLLPFFMVKAVDEDLAHFCI